MGVKDDRIEDREGRGFEWTAFGGFVFVIVGLLVALSFGSPVSILISLAGLRLAALLPAIVKSLAQVRAATSTMISMTVRISELRLSMVLDEDVMAKTGVRIAPRGQEVTQTLQVRLRNFAERAGVIEPIRVLMPR